jgi:CheY-like chemotaxis protein
MNSLDRRPILIVEDNDEDFEATMWVLRKSAYDVPVVRCKDGSEAVAYLDKNDATTGGASAPIPAIVLLDLNMPRMDGRQVLKHIKTSANLSSLPVIVVTTSAMSGDVTSCYRLGANSYVVKPVNMVKLREMVNGLIDYWFGLVQLPQSEGRNEN